MDRADTRPDLSVVVPVFSCASCLDELGARLRATLEGLVASYEILLVDDRSSDGGWTAVERLARSNPNVHGLRLSRNFGQQAAITAGLSEASGRHIVVMDCDLQDPPEEIPLLYRTALEGFDIVLGRRRARHEGAIRRWGTRAYLWLTRRFLKVEIDGSFGSFSVISDRVRDAFLSLRDRDRHYLFILSWLGFEHTSVEVGRDPRHSGASGYTFGALVRHAFDGVFFQTTVLLRWIVYLGFALSLVGVVLAGLFVAIYFTGHPYPGWTSLSVLLLIVGGFIIMSTGVAGLYVGKIFDQVKGRPLYVVDRRTHTEIEARETEHARSS